MVFGKVYAHSHSHTCTHPPARSRVKLISAYYDCFLLEKSSDFFLSFEWVKRPLVTQSWWRVRTDFMGGKNSTSIWAKKYVEQHAWAHAYFEPGSSCWSISIRNLKSTPLSRRMERWSFILRWRHDKHIREALILINSALRKLFLPYQLLSTVTKIVT